MKRKLGNYIIAAFFINVFAIMSVGGVCVLMVKDMVNNISYLEKESENVSTIDDINAKILRMISSIDHAIIYADKTRILDAVRFIDDVQQEIEQYKKIKKEWKGPKDTGETELLIQIQSNLADIKTVLMEQHDAFSVNRTITTASHKNLEHLAANIHGLTKNIKDIHSEISAVLVKSFYDKMYFILVLYLVSSFIGILASCVGYIILSRHTILPIKKLADATRKVAIGDLSTRVDTKSTTEIGTLYDSFNLMTEKLQEIERKRDRFNLELKQKVQNRTFQLREAQSEIVRMEKIAALGEIATSVNHEIKTPLNSLYMNLQLLAKKIRKCVPDSEENKESMLSLASTLYSEISRINGILEEFVKYARFAPPDLKKSDLNKILNKIVEMISQSAEQAGVDINLILDEKVVPIMLDAKKITQALLNICVNAIHAMPEGGILTIESNIMKESVIITITDTGIGMSEEELDKIFDPFFTKKEDGLGIGLPIVQRIIEDHKGYIGCRSKVNDFTSFEIVLPRLLLT